MCRVHNQIGSLKAIHSHLHFHNISDYSSINDLIDFKNNYLIKRQQIFSDHKVLITEEKNTLNAEIIHLDNSIKEKKKEFLKQLLREYKITKLRLNNLNSTPSNGILVHSHFLLKIVLRLQIQLNKLIYYYKTTYSLKKLINKYNEKYNRHQYILLNFDSAVEESSFHQVHELDRKKEIIDQINSSIFGAIGEQKVVKELEKLSDDYILINDFTRRFQPSIYNRKENDYIKSIQIDHILIAPSGVFLIETKNWSQNSLQNPNLFSPVQQIKRTNLALYKILNGGISKSKIVLRNHFWGRKKIPIKNLIVFMNHKPKEEFDYVKILTLNELLGYIKYFQPCFSDMETEKIANYLLKYG